MVGRRNYEMLKRHAGDRCVGAIGPTPLNRARGPVQGAAAVGTRREKVRDYLCGVLGVER